MQKLAKIVLKVNQFGSTVTLQYVTPAELMMLVSEHHVNAGGDPVVKLTEIPEDTESNKILELQKDLDKSVKNRDKVENLSDTEITEEIRERRTTTLTNKINALQSQIDVLNNIVARRKAFPAQERAYLMSKYQAVRVKKLYPDAMPRFPETFDEARSTGKGVENGSDQRLMFEPSGMLASA